MKALTITLAATALILLTAVAAADDHLFQAQQHGLAAGSNGGTNSNAFVTNPAGHSGNDASGQGSPFTGNDTVTPSSDQGQAHANVKPRV
jgi:hypothetical protein